jgi:hypothetical protein
MIKYCLFGILNKSGMVISAGKGGRRKLSTLEITDKRFIPSIRALKISEFGNPQFIKWECK